MKFISSVLMVIIISGLAAMQLPFSNTLVKSEANLLGEMVRVSPDDKKSLEYKTDVYLWYDDEKLYAYFEAELNPDFAKGTYAAGESFPDADFLRLQLVTSPESYFAYCFYAFPLGNKYDAVRDSNLQLDENWNSEYSYSNEFTEDKWTCLMEIPFKDLRYTNNDVKNWKVISSRRLLEEDDYYSFPYTTTKMGKDYFLVAEDIQLTEEITTLSNLKIRPYFVQKYDKMNNEFSKFDENIGVDISYNPTTSTKLKISIQPDFSDVPMDDEQDNFNIRYAPYFQENRFFFTEDIDVFGVNEQLFYSRNLMQPIFATKLTGNGKNYSFGFLISQDKEVKNGESVNNADDYYSLAAYKISNDKASLQSTFLSTFNDDFHNEVMHIESVYEFSKKSEIELGANVSFVDRDSKSKYGSEFFTRYSFDSEIIDFRVKLGRMDDGLTALMGRIFENNYSYSNINLDIDYDFDEGGIFEQIGISGWTDYNIQTDSNDFGSTNAGCNLWFGTRFDLNFWTNANSGKYYYEDLMKNINWNNYSAGIGYFGFSGLGMNASYSQGLGLHFERLKNYVKRNLNFSIWGDLGYHYSYSVNVSKIHYLDFEKEFITEILDEDGENIIYRNDNDYLLGNIKFSINLSNECSLTNGLGFNSYEQLDAGFTKHVGLFSNLKWEFMDDYFVYAGYSTALDEVDNQGIFDDSRILNYELLYMKLSVTF